MALNPNIKWAERKDKLFITIELNEVKDPKIDITEDNRLKFTGLSENKNYTLDLELFGEVEKSASKWTLDTRNIFLNIKKKTKGPYWNYINKDKKKYHYIHPDWNNYVEEEEEDEKPEFGGFPGFGGNDFDMGGADDLPDEDDEVKKDAADLNDLDKPEENKN